MLTRPRLLYYVPLPFLLPLFVVFLLSAIFGLVDLLRSFASVFCGDDDGWPVAMIPLFSGSLSMLFVCGIFSPPRMEATEDPVTTSPQSGDFLRINFWY